ncbi:TPA: GlsB/YeaQ/YmgE family stress response membrane protein, partial [Enterococcus faecalis]|nr:GlsB/YeaQ/YmgE family stress response membrane protein [Enterococcus faecalis]
ISALLGAIICIAIYSFIVNRKA